MSFDFLMEDLTMLMLVLNSQCSPGWHPTHHDPPHLYLLNAWVTDMCYCVQLAKCYHAQIIKYLIEIYSGEHGICCVAEGDLEFPVLLPLSSARLIDMTHHAQLYFTFLIWQFQIINVACYILLLDSTVFKIEICSVCSKWF